MSNSKALVIIIWVLIISYSFLPSVFAANSEKELTHCLIQARIQYDNSRYKEAADWWNKALALDPENKEALKYIKKIKEELDRPKVEEKEPQAETAVPPKQPQDKPSQMKQRASKYILQGKKYYCQHMYKWAVSEWQKALKIDPSNTEVAEYI